MIIKKKKAFTLLEILVAVVVIGILATITIISLEKTRSRSRDAKRLVDIQQVQTALESYFLSRGYYPENLKEGDPIKSPDGFVYLASFPKAPKVLGDNEGNCVDGPYIYSQERGGASYKVSFCLESDTGDLKAGENIAEPGKIKEMVYTLVLLSESLPNGQVNSVYSGHTFGAIHGIEPYSFSLASGTLPPGLSLNSNGQLSGTPNTYGQYNFSISVTDAESNIDTQDFLINIIVALGLGGTNPPNGIKNTPYPGYNFNASGGVPPYTFSLSSGSLPAGLSLSSNGSLSGTPSTEGSSTFTIKVVDSFSSEVSKQFSMSINPPPFVCGNKFTDSRDGRKYLTVKIGTQCWMKENLAYLPEVHDNPTFTSRGNSGQAAYGVYDYNGNNVDIAKGYSNYITYGVLYNWHAAKISCPAGWRLPFGGDPNKLNSSEDDWNTLVEYLGGNLVAGGKAKSTGIAYWDPPNTGATNASGFTALPGGFRYAHGIFGNLFFGAFFWTASSEGSSNAWRRPLYYNGTELFADYHSPAYGLSVRCILDE